MAIGLKGRVKASEVNAKDITGDLSIRESLIWQRY
jgi:hypothetical protein